MSTPEKVSRRTLLRGLAAGSLATGLAACGARSTPSPSPSVGPTARPASSAPSPVPTEVPTRSPETPTPTSDPARLRRKIGRLLMVGFRGFTIGPDDPITGALEAGLGGVILFDRDQVTGTRNIESPEQLAALTASLRAAAPGNLIVAIDQEGGRVSRLKPARGFPDTRSQAEVGATDDPDEAFEAGRSMAATMSAAGLPDAVMTGHIVNARLDPGVPASLSVATVEGLLRGRLGWTGAVITDDLGAEAIASRYTREDAVALALEAGNDLLLFANQTVYVPDLATELVETILALVASGRIVEARIDQSIERLDVLAVGSAIE